MWTPTTRQHHNRPVTRYQTDLTDAEWRVIVMGSRSHAGFAHHRAVRGECPGGDTAATGVWGSVGFRINSSHRPWDADRKSPLLNICSAPLQSKRWRRAIVYYVLPNPELIGVGYVFQESNPSAPRWEPACGEGYVAVLFPRLRSPCSRGTRFVTSGRPQNANENAREIDQSSAPLKLSDAQRERIRSMIAALPAPPRITNQPLTVSVGAAVPRQVPLKQLPTELATLLNGFQGDDYVLVGDQLVIVDAAVRRVVAIFPNAA